MDLNVGNHVEKLLPFHSTHHHHILNLINQNLFITLNHFTSLLISSPSIHFH